MRKAFLLAAGLGTRLRPLTEHLPKCLLPIAGRPLLAIWLDLLESHGITQVLINTHWQHQRVERFLATWPSDRLHIIQAHEPELLGSAGTLWTNRHWIANREPFLILYGDNLTNANLTSLMSFHRRHGLPFTLGVFPARDPTRCGIAEVNSEGIVTGFEEKPEQPRSNLAAAGLYAADSRIFTDFPIDSERPPGPLDLSFHILPRLIGRMKAYPIGDFLIDIGTPESYELAQKSWISRDPQKGRS
ncbi:MAG: nucleotidyl transferase [Syntrophobacteraceae bacterium CG07_land_8_20_14_0_80_61_8]|nr:MAG: nucleotidyl transferase [Syntrophobacteraceae bacterium CG07_land_8_20_14_0_80_61_8]